MTPTKPPRIDTKLEKKELESREVACLLHTHTHKHSLPREGESFFSGAGIRYQNAVRFKAGMNNTEKAPEIAAAEKGKDVVSVSTAVASLTSSSLACVHAE